MAEERIPPEELRREQLSEKHREIINSFETDEIELKKFLIEDALNNQDRAISDTYLWFYNPKNELAGYMTLLSDAVRVHGTSLGQSFLDKGVAYKTLPALKIGRICVDKKYLRKGVGTEMLAFAARTVLEINRKVGCRFVVVDAKQDARHFYSKLNFQILKDREKGTVPMFFDMIRTIRYQRQLKKEAEKLQS